MPGFPKTKPPANRVALERWIGQKAQEDGIAADRLRRAVSFMVLSAVLARFVDEEGAPLFLLKGGVAMELRVGTRARASKDYDTAFREDLARLDDILATASVHVHGDFRLTAGAATPIGPTGAVRIPVRISLARYDWGTIDLEVSAAEGGSGTAAAIEYASPAPALSVFGLPDGERVALFPLPYLTGGPTRATRRCSSCRAPGRPSDRSRPAGGRGTRRRSTASPRGPRRRRAAAPRPPSPHRAPPRTRRSRRRGRCPGSRAWRRPRSAVRPSAPRRPSRRSSG